MTLFPLLNSELSFWPGDIVMGWIVEHFFPSPLPSEQLPSPPVATMFSPTSKSPDVHVLGSLMHWYAIGLLCVAVFGLYLGVLRAQQTYTEIIYMLDDITRRIQDVQDAVEQMEKAQSAKAAAETKKQDEDGDGVAVGAGATEGEASPKIEAGPSEEVGGDKENLETAVVGIVRGLPCPAVEDTPALAAAEGNLSGDDDDTDSEGSLPALPTPPSETEEGENEWIVPELREFEMVGKSTLAERMKIVGPAKKVRFSPVIMMEPERPPITTKQVRFRL